MTVSLNHTIVYARDQESSAKFLSEIMGLSPHTHFGHFAVVQVGEASLDFMKTDGEIASQHYAFLLSEAEFKQILQRIKKGTCRTGPIPRVRNHNKSTRVMAGTVSTSKIPMVISWKS